MVTDWKRTKIIWVWKSTRKSTIKIHAELQVKYAAYISWVAAKNGGVTGRFTPSPGVALLVAPLFLWLQLQSKIAKQVGQTFRRSNTKINLPVQRWTNWCENDIGVTDAWNSIGDGCDSEHVSVRGFKDGIGGAHVFGDIQLFANGHQRGYDIFGTLGPPWALETTQISLALRTFSIATKTFARKMQIPRNSLMLSGHDACEWNECIRVSRMNVFVWMEWMSEAFARDCQVKMWMAETSLIVAKKLWMKRKPLKALALEWKTIIGCHLRFDVAGLLLSGKSYTSPSPQHWFGLCVDNTLTSPIVVECSFPTFSVARRPLELQIGLVKLVWLVLAGLGGGARKLQSQGFWGTSQIEQF